MTSTTRSTTKRSSWLARLLPPIIVIAVLIAIWELCVRAGGVSERVLASPSAIVSAIIANWPSLMRATATTLAEGLIGFLIAIVLGVLLGIGLYTSRTFHNAVYPLLVAAQTIPLITIAPLFMIWFGFEPFGKVVIVAVFALFPIAVQTVRGLNAVPSFYEDVAITCGATRLWTLLHVKLRVAARQIFGGIRIAAAYVFGTAVTAEYLGARTGLGIWLQSAFNSFRTPLIFAATIVVIVLTALLIGAVSLVEWLLLGPADDERAAQTAEQH